MNSFTGKDPLSEIQPQEFIDSLLESIWNFIATVFSWCRVIWMVRKLPGPPGKPIIGHLGVYSRPTKSLEIIKKLQNEFPICNKNFMTFYPQVFVHSPEAVQEILSKKQKHNDKGSVYHTLLPLLGEGLITSKGEKWLKRRKMVTPAFHFNILEGFFEVFTKRSTEYIKQLKEASINNDFFDIIPHNKKVTMNFILETAIGVPEGFHHERLSEVIKALQRLEEIALYRCWKPWLLVDGIFKWTPSYREQEHHRKILERFTSEIIKNRRIALANESNEEWYSDTKKNTILIDLLLKQSEGGKLLTDEEIREEINTFVFAGQTTTMLAISYCIYLLGLYPDEQKRAADEVDEIFGDSKRDPTLMDLKRMYFIERCIKEALRLYPSVPILARRITEDQTLGDYVLPKNVDCIVFPYVLHRNPKQFPNPEVFNPDNFLPENSKDRHAYSYIPFSAGPRNCVGKRFANNAMKTVISWVLREFKIESLRSQDKLNLIPSTVLVPLGGLKVKLTLRKTGQ
ncbi:cytochrome P450 4C1-like isoform X2 [Cimex lectularius]|uniref:Cytochrome P450 n=1 Tax=Cimex lectularius TaxID=79782 RepID=A0A8I6RZE5_CIMLE|nr:cytochrome P450 4C1-like isoform X2 [Cimex lectularius]